MKLIRVLLACAFVVAVATGTASAKSFSIPRFHSDVEVLDDGAIRVTESITYRFDGRFTYAFRVVPLGPGESISELGVREGNIVYNESSSEGPQTFYAARTASGMRVRWYYRADDETRTFSFRYTLRGAVARYPDAAVYYHKLIGDASNPRMGEVTARVTLPGRGWYPSDVRAWAHGPLHGTVSIESGNVVTAAVKPLPAGEFFELRIAMPPDPFSSMALKSSQPVMPTILAEEERWADQANRRRERIAAAHERAREARALRRERARRWFPIAWVLAALSVLMWVLLFRRYGNPHAVSVHAPPGEPPSDHPPAIVAQLLARGSGGPALVSTLLDLAERGYLTVEEVVKHKKGWFGRESRESDFVFRSTGENPGVLLPFEAELLQFLFNDVGDGTTFTMSDVTQTARKKSTQFRRWYLRWNKGVRKTAWQEDFFEPYAVLPMVANGVAGLVVAGIGLAMCIATDSAAGAPALMAGLLQSILTGLLHRRTPAGQRLYREWKGFQKFLRARARGTGALSITSQSWGRYVALAIVFGMHKELIPRLAVDGSETGAYMPLWYVWASGGSGVDGLTASLSGMVASVTTTMSSASGAGGGASAGGGGGAGGGSAGAG